MSERPRFTIEMTIRDNYSYESYHHAIGCDQALRIDVRAVDELKSGLGLIGMDQAVQMMKTKDMRRDLLREAAIMLAGQIADRLQDAEGWHDQSRVEPARKALGAEFR